jgi:TolB-like protein/Tfp pilus assembly protein PilF
MSLFTELKRRNVFKVATAYVVVGWLLTEIATTLLPTFGAPDWVAKAIIFLFALAFIPVLVFAWAFELTPEGIKREKDVDRSQSITGQTGQKLNYVTIAAVVIGIGFVVMTRPANHEQPNEPEVIVTTGAPSVAVLPFVNMSGNAENEYFSDGLTETLLHMLAQIPDLKVAARTSSFAFKGQQDDIREIADALDVAHVLEGSVQRAGDRVRITAQLIRASDGFHVWSENYDRTLDDIFAIQDEIAGKVGLALSASLLGAKEPAPIVSVGTENLEAYDKFLLAHAEHLKGSYGSLKVAEGLLKDALALDSDFLEAKTELGLVYIDQWRTGLSSEDKGLVDTVRLVEQVLAERPDDVRARTALYQAEIFGDIFANNIPAAIETAELLDEHASEHRKDVDTVMAAADILARFGHEERAFELVQGLVDVDPLNPTVYEAQANMLRRLERWEEARQAAQRSIELEPEQPNVHTLVADTYRAEGNIVEWLRHYFAAMEIDPKDHELPGEVAEVLYQLNLPEQAAEFRARVRAIAPSSPAAYLLDVLHAEAIQDLEAARAAARRAIEKDIDNRQDAYENTVRFLVRDAIAHGTAAETLAYLYDAIPSLADFDAPPERIKEQIARFAVLPLWPATLPEDEWKRRIRVAIDYGAQFGLDPNGDSMAGVVFRFVEGHYDEARDTLVRIFETNPVGTFLNWRETMDRPVFADLVDDPQVQAGLRKYAADEAALRESVRAFLAERERGTGT